MAVTIVLVRPFLRIKDFFLTVFKTSLTLKPTNVRINCRLCRIMESTHYKTIKFFKQQKTILWFQSWVWVDYTCDRANCMLFRGMFCAGVNSSYMMFLGTLRSSFPGSWRHLFLLGHVGLSSPAAAEVGWAEVEEIHERVAADLSSLVYCVEGFEHFYKVSSVLQLCWKEG